MNNKGFTVVELLASFTITMIILVFLLEILLEVKSIYYGSEIKSEVYNKNAIIASALNKRLNQYYIVSVLTDNTLIKQQGCDIPSDNSSNIAIGTLNSRNSYDEPMYFFISIKTNDTSNAEVSIRGCDVSPNGFEDITIKMPENTSILAHSNEEIVTTNTVYSGGGKKDSYIKITYDVSSNKLSEDIDFNYVHTYSSV